MHDFAPCQSSSALVAVHFWFLGLVDVCEVARGFPASADPTNMAFLMPYLEEAVDDVLAIALLEEILHGPSSDREE